LTGRQAALITSDSFKRLKCSAPAHCSFSVTKAARSNGFLAFDALQKAH
jgi:hypothetical protein